MSEPLSAADGRMALDARWRSSCERLQEDAVPSGEVVVSCPAPLGAGGLGRHLQEILDALERRNGRAPACICLSTPARAESAARRLERAAMRLLLAPVVRFSPSARVRVKSARFDARAARELPVAADHLIAFNGTALAQFRTAARRGSCTLALVSANSHIRHVVRQHERAYEQYPVERPWATRVVSRNLREYQQAEHIYVASDYIRESFLSEGFAEEALSFFPLTPHPRFNADDRRPEASTFDVVYVGGLLVHKGVPLLLDAFSRLPHADMRLILVGGWKTSAMRRFVEAAQARDERIEVRPGDPLPTLRSASVCVHPSYEDGFAYAPAEALAGGVPVLVSEDTGMKELIPSDRHGMVLPTGELDALVEALDAAYKREILIRLPG